MNISEIKASLENLYAELDEVKAMTEQRACDTYNVNSKSEIIAIIHEDITALEKNYAQATLPDDDGMDYAALQLSQGMAAVYW